MAFWTLNGEVLTAEQGYHEVAPQLVLMAFLHRIVNGGGYIDREYGVRRGRIDLLVRLNGYLDRMGLSTGVLVVFDRRAGAAPITDRTRFGETTSPSGRTITLLRA